MFGVYNIYQIYEIIYSLHILILCQSINDLKYDTFNGNKNQNTLLKALLIFLRILLSCVWQNCTSCLLQLIYLQIIYVFLYKKKGSFFFLSCLFPVPSSMSTHFDSATGFLIFSGASFADCSEDAITSQTY